MYTQMYVITHKKTKLPLIPGYKSLLVGAALNQAEDEFDFRDNTGDNISVKNRNYCELTGLYWIWKNTTDHIVGICHYRRFFVKKGYFLLRDSFLSNKDIENIMEYYDVILPEAKVLHKNTVLCINYAPNMEDMQEIQTAISVLYPEYLNDYRAYLKQNKTYLFNMCVMKRIYFDAYCNWIFDILEYVEVHHDMEKETDNYRKRLFGFLSERLIYVWVRHNISSKKIYEAKVINTDEKEADQKRHDIRNIINCASYALTGKSVSNRHKEEERMNYIFK